MRPAEYKFTSGQFFEGTPEGYLAPSVVLLNTLLPNRHIEQRQDILHRLQAKTHQEQNRAKRSESAR
jgi:hypothetical protein